jgi:hypothetical protein
VIFLGDFSFVRIFLKNLYRVNMTTCSVVGIPTGDTFIPRDISVGILKPRGCSYHCASGRSFNFFRYNHLLSFLFKKFNITKKGINIKDTLKLYAVLFSCFI